MSSALVVRLAKSGTRLLCGRTECGAEIVRVYGTRFPKSDESPSYRMPDGSRIRGTKPPPPETPAVDDPFLGAGLWIKFSPEWRLSAGIWRLTNAAKDARRRVARGEPGRMRKVHPPQLPNRPISPAEFRRLVRIPFRSPNYNDPLSRERSSPTLPCNVACPGCGFVQTIPADILG